MGFNTYERKLTDEFFNSEIGRVVKDAIYNDMTISCNDIGFITGGEYNSNDTTIVYEPTINQPIIRTGNISYYDTLLVENVPDDDIQPVYNQASYSTNNGMCIEYAINMDRDKPFYLIWTTTIIVNNEPVNTYTRRIKVVPKVIPEKE